MELTKSLIASLFGLLLLATGCNNTINQTNMNEQNTSTFQGSIGNETYTFQTPTFEEWKTEITTNSITYISNESNGASVKIPVQQLEIKAKPDYLDSFAVNSNKVQYKQESSEENIRLMFHLDGSFVEVNISKYDKFDHEAVAKEIVNTFKIK